MCGKARRDDADTWYDVFLRQKCTNGHMGKKKERKGYFYEKEEQAIIDYIQADTKEEKNNIFNKFLLPAFTKMIESIIRRYNLYPQDEEFRETFDETLSFLISKIDRFDPTKGFKAYSYCGTICKNHLIGKINKILKEKKKNVPSELVDSTGGLSDNIKYSYDDGTNDGEFITELIETMTVKTQEILDKKESYKLTENEEKIGHALIDILSNWEDMFAILGSNKFNKSSILLYLKETTLLSPKEIRNGMKKYKAAYYEVKNSLL